MNEEGKAPELDSPRLHGLARELADLTGVSVTGAVEVALREAIARRRAVVRAKRERIGRIARHCAALPVLDDRPIEEILGYDEVGLPN